MAAPYTRTLRELAKRPRGVVIIAMLKPGLRLEVQRACARSLRGKSRELRLYPSLNLVRVRLREPVLRMFAQRDEVVEIAREPAKKPTAIIERRRVSQKRLQESFEDRTERSGERARAGKRSPAKGARRAASPAKAARPAASPTITDPSPPLLTGRRPWGINSMNVQPVWDRGFQGSGVVVAHLDTGVHEDHEAFKGRLAARAVITDSGDLRHTNKMVDSQSRGDLGGHGTHTAASICGQLVGDVRVGVAPSARLASATVMEGGTLMLRVLRALQWVLDKRAAGVNIRVLNLSLGFPGWQGAFVSLVRDIEAARILTVASVGNDGPRTSRSPGNYLETLSVGAYGKDDTMWQKSSSNQWRGGESVPDLVAPGVDIASADSNSKTGWYVLHGTSMATAYASGLAALLFSAHEKATPGDVKAAILDGCTPLGDVATLREGRGRPDAVKALEKLNSIMAKRAVDEAAES